MQYTTNNNICDYHFAVRLSNGEWADKPSTDPSRYGKLSFNGIAWIDEEAKINTATADSTCFFVITIG